MAIEFNETQRLKTWWVWGALIAVNGIFVFAIIQQIIIGKPFGNTPLSNKGLLLAAVIPVAVLGFVISIRFVTNISAAGIRYRYYPFQFDTTLIEWEELSDVYMRKYSSFYEYGGWGIRVGGAKTNRAINTSASCNIGLQLEFKNGNQLLIGTRKPAEIEALLNQLLAANKIGWKVNLN